MIECIPVADGPFHLIVGANLYNKDAGISLNDTDRESIYVTCQCLPAVHYLIVSYCWPRSVSVAPQVSMVPYREKGGLQYLLTSHIARIP